MAENRQKKELTEQQKQQLIQETEKAIAETLQDDGLAISIFRYVCELPYITIQHQYQYCSDHWHLKVLITRDEDDLD